MNQHTGEGKKVFPTAATPKGIGQESKGGEHAITTAQINEPDSVEFSARAESTLGPRLGLALSPANGTATTIVAALDLLRASAAAGIPTPSRR